MSQKISGGAAILVGLVVAVASVFSGGAASSIFAGVLAGLTTVAGGIAALCMSPNINSQAGATFKDLQMATSTEGYPIPVIFGVQRVVPNYMNYSKANFHSEELTEDAGKSDGGGQVIGHQYFLTYEIGLCMGPIDEVRQVFGVPGEYFMRGPNPATLTFGNADSKDFPLSGLNLGIGKEYGTVRIYKGSRSQTRFNGGLGDDPYYSGFPSTFDGITASQVGTTATISEPLLTSLYVGSTIQWADASTVTITAVRSPTSCTVSGGSHTRPLESINIIPAANVEAGSTMNYRGVCWALHGPGVGPGGHFSIGLLPQPRTYQYLIGRRPSHDENDTMLRPDGSPIFNANSDPFPVRGSNDPAKRCYDDANPAAIIYEILTDQLWGRGIDPTAIDEESFVRCARFFAAHNIGMSFTMSQAEPLDQIIDAIKNHLKMMVLVDGEKIKLKTLLDISQTHSTIFNLNRSKINKPKFTRPDWSSTYNEIRAEFTNRDKNYRPDLVHVQDLGNIQINEGVLNPQSMTLNGFTDWNLTRQQAFRFLRELSYPLAVLTFEMNRYESRMEPGDCFRYIDDEWTDTMRTGYWIVTAIERDSSTDEVIKVSAIEDMFLGNVDGKELSTELPTVYPWEKLADLSPQETGLWNKASTNQNAIVPVQVFELPAIITQGVVKTAFLGERVQQSMTGFNAYWQKGANWVKIGTQNSFAIAGALIADIPTVYHTDRTVTGIRVELANETADKVNFLSVNQCVHNTDSLETLENSGLDYLIIGDEIMQIGYVEAVGTNDYRVRNIIRGLFGTDVTTHSAGDPVFYVKSLPAGMTTPNTVAGNLPIDATLNFKVYPVSVSGESQTGDPFTAEHDDYPTPTHFLGLGKRPLEPVFVSLTPIAGIHFSLIGYKVVIQPKFFNQGAGVNPFIYAMQHPLANLDNLSFKIEAVSNLPYEFQPNPDEIITFSSVYTPEKISNTSGGIVTLTIPMDTGAGFSDAPLLVAITVTAIRIHAVYNGIYSVRTLDIPVPDYVKTPTHPLI